MINSIGSRSSYYNSLLATNGTSGTSSTNSSFGLQQFETNAGDLASALQGQSAGGTPATAASTVSATA